MNRTQQLAYEVLRRARDRGHGYANHSDDELRHIVEEETDEFALECLLDDLADDMLDLPVTLAPEDGGGPN